MDNGQWIIEILLLTTDRLVFSADNRYSKHCSGKRVTVLHQIMENIQWINGKRACAFCLKL